jgi:hypothetical protein
MSRSTMAFASGRVNRGDDSVDADASGTLPTVAAVDCVAIPQEMARLAFQGVASISGRHTQAGTWSVPGRKWSPPPASVAHWPSWRLPTHPLGLPHCPAFAEATLTRHLHARVWLPVGAQQHQREHPR